MVQSSALMHMPSISLHLNNAQPASEEDQLPVLERSWHRAPNGAGAGLANMGNTCYMNSVLQCLAHLPPLANIVHAQSHSRSCSHYQQGSTCICCLVENQLWQQLYYGNRSPFKPDKLYDGLLQLRRGFQRWRQEDAHELLRCLTDAMEGCLLRQSLGYNPQRPPRCPKTWVNLMFSGILQSQVRCLRCGYVSNSYDPFMDLSLELHNSCRQLGHCLQHFTAAETLDGKNSYRCDGCKQLVPARKQITIWDDPNILVVHLKRFHDFSGQKINQPIQFPMSLDLEPFLCPTRALQQQQQQQQQQHSLLGPARPLQQQQQQPGVAVFTGSGYTRVGGGAVGGVGPGWGAGDQQRQQQQQQEKLLMHQQHQQHQHLLQKKAAGQQQQHSWQQQEQQHDGACANGSSSSGNRSSPGVYDLHGVLVHKGCTANSGHYYSYVRGGNPATQWFCANDSSVYRVQGPAEVMGQTRDAYMLFYVRRSMKQQAELPVQPEPPAAAAAAAAAAPAAVAAGLRKRALSSADGNGSPDSCSTRVFVGPQLPPHLQKRQRVAEQQQRQEAADVDMFADEEEPSAAVAAAIGPQLPSDWRPSAAAKAAAAAIGPQLPPGWKPSAAAAAASGNGSSAASESTAGLTAVDVVQAAAVLLPHDAAAEPSTQHGTAAAGAALSPAAAAAHAPEARAAGAAGGGSLLQRAAAAQLPAASPAAAAAAAAAAVPLSSVSGDGDGSGALAGMLAGYGDDDDDDADIAPAPTQTSPQQQHQKQLPAPQEQQHLPQPQPAQQPERARGSNAGSAARSRRSSSGGGAAAAIDTVVTPVMLKSELWDAIAERKQAFKPTLVAELEKARDEGTPLPQVKPVLLTLFRGSAAVKEAAESVLSHAVKIAQSALSACL